MTSQIYRRGAPIIITPRFQTAEVAQDKTELRQKIQDQVDDFLQAGGRVNQIPPGVSGELQKEYGAILLGHTREEMKRKGKRGAARTNGARRKSV